MRVLLIVPAFNEAENLERVVGMIKQACPEYDYIIINDGSTDGTALLCREHGYPMLDLPVNLGLAGGFQAGVRYAELMGYDAVLQFDGDGQHDAHYIRELVDKMERDDNDIVIGSRYINEKKPWTPRMIGSRLLGTVIKLTTGTTIKDPTSGMRLFGWRVFHVFSSKMNCAPEPDTLCYLLRSGAKVSEIQVKMQERIAGESYLNWTRSLEYMINMVISILFVQWFRRRQ